MNPRERAIGGYHQKKSPRQGAPETTEARTEPGFCLLFRVHP
jgi:hypothetical protein